MTHEMTTVIENTETRRFRKKPVVIEAIRLPLPGEDHQKVADLFDFMGAAEWEIGIEGMYIKTLEGTMHASPGDWIIRGIKGELYPCKPDIFAATYEPESGLAEQATQATDSTISTTNCIRCGSLRRDDGSDLCLSGHPMLLAASSGERGAALEEAALLCDHFTTPYDRAGSEPDAVEGQMRKMAARIRALAPTPATVEEPKV